MTNTPSLQQQAAQALQYAIDAAFPAAAGADPLIRPSDHADLQANAALALAKQVQSRPRDVAEAIVAALDSDVIAATEISGPGFINLTLSDETLWQQAHARSSDDRLGIDPVLSGHRMVVDYSGPNIAKEMHVGHLRSSVIGDAIARISEFLGADVIRQNHIGDWGTQFGMLIEYLIDNPDEPWRAGEIADDDNAESAVSALNQLYKNARATFDTDPDFADRARRRVVDLQAGDPETVALWQEIRTESEGAFAAVYERLGLSLTLADTAGESFYNDKLADVTSELVAKGVAVESDGALVVLSEEITAADDRPAVLMVRKSDGGYGYGTTDLATIRYRINELSATDILYVVGAPQALHFQLLFEAARRAGWLTDDIRATHVPFGSVLGADGKPFKTREGKAARLMDLLDEAVDAARRVLIEGAEAKGTDLDELTLRTISEAAGIGAVKYADLSTSRVKDYVFAPERMVAFNGNTGVYLQYAHTRMVSLLRRALPEDVRSDETLAVTAVDVIAHESAGGELEPAERALILAVDGLGDVLEGVARELTPHLLCTYAYNLARAFTDFYEAAPVLAAEGAIRERRLALVSLARRTLASALDLLGIVAPERM